jgi:hypothetical protein
MHFAWSYSFFRDWRHKCGQPSSILHGQFMNTENENRGPQPDEGSDKWGMILVLIFALGLPILGILYGIFFGEPAK